MNDDKLLLIWEPGSLSFFKKIQGLAYATMTDIGMGLIVIFIFNLFFDLSWWYYGIGGFLGIVPDLIDMIYEKLTGKGGSYHKYFVTHLPSSILMSVCIGLVLNICYELPILIWMLYLIWPLHLLHDSFEPEGAINLFGPFNKDTYRLGINKKFPFIFVKSELIPMPLTEWIQKYYLTNTAESIAGKIIFTIGIVLALSDILFL